MEEPLKIKILLMDGEKNSCEEMQEFLQKQGFIVYPAYSAKEGKLILEQMQIHLLILDTQLPDADGLELLKEYKTSYPALEVILISGQGDMNSVIQAMRLRALDFLRKPLRQTDLQSAIERSLILRSRTDPSRNDKNSLRNFHMAL